jgi:hypothetical protein
VGTGRECAYLRRLRCQILHVWVLFPPDFTLKSPFCSICLLEGLALFQRTLTEIGHQNVEGDGDKVVVHGASKCYDLERQCET